MTWPVICGRSYKGEGFHGEGAAVDRAVLKCSVPFPGVIRGQDVGDGSDHQILPATSSTGIMNPLCLTHMATHDVAIDVCQALMDGLGIGEVEVRPGRY
jgi:hypothetical protein